LRTLRPLSANIRHHPNTSTGKRVTPISDSAISYQYSSLSRPLATQWLHMQPVRCTSRSSPDSAHGQAFPCDRVPWDATSANSLATMPASIPTEAIPQAPNVSRSVVRYSPCSGQPTAPGRPRPRTPRPRPNRGHNASPCARCVGLACAACARNCGPTWRSC
jgi:hypothetical protein